MSTDASSCTTHEDASPTIFESFIQDFRFKLADDEETKQRIFALRYEIYCEELRYEEPAELTEKIEKDLYDDQSLHCLIEHRRSGQTAGCMRLVIPNKSNSPRLPLQAYDAQRLTHSSLHPDILPTLNICEVSRLAISNKFRKPAKNDENNNKYDIKFTAEEIRTFPLILVGLFLATYALVGLAERPHVFAMMEPRLAKLLSRSGFNFTKVGETIEFHGKRSAYYINQKSAEEEMKEELAPLYLYVQKQLGPQLKSVQLKGRTAALA